MQRIDLCTFNNKCNCDIDLTNTNVIYFGYPHNCHNVNVKISRNTKYIRTIDDCNTIERAFKYPRNNSNYTFEYVENLSTNTSTNDIKTKIEQIKKIKSFNKEHQILKLVIYPQMTDDEINLCLKLIDKYSDLINSMINYNKQAIQNKNLYNEYLELFN